MNYNPYNAWHDSCSNSTGRRVTHIHRFNKNTTTTTIIISDIPTEAALGLANWGEIEVEQPGKYVRL